MPSQGQAIVPMAFSGVFPKKKIYGLSRDMRKEEGGQMVFSVEGIFLVPARKGIGYGLTMQASYVGLLLVISILLVAI